MKKTIGKDFTSLVNNEYLTNMAESHIECWKDRYFRKSKKDIKFDLQVNHDDSCEIERVEEDLKRPLTDDENSMLITLFHNKVIQVF
jgi:hypothetical protein